MLTNSALDEPRALNIQMFKNQKVISELTKDGSSITEWDKFTTSSLELWNGQNIQVHFYKNLFTDAVNYNIDYKVNTIIDPLLPVKPQVNPIIPSYEP